MKKILSTVTVLVITLLCTASAVADSGLSPSAVISLLQSSYSSVNGLELEYDYNEETSFYCVYLTIDGMAACASGALTDNDTMESWIGLRDSIAGMSDSISVFISTLTGDSSPSLSMNLRNDANPDNILISMLNSTVIYDVVTGVNTGSNKTGATTADTDSATLGEQNALKAAKQYLAYTAFSYTGLIDQLEYEGYSSQEATYGADHCGADWGEQALQSAIQYLGYTAFSYSGLIDQLEYEGFSSQESKYGADHCGADWNEQAVKCAKQYLDYTSFSKKGLIEQLEYEGFTNSQAKYGAAQNGY